MNQKYKNRNCEWCGDEFTPASPTTKFCQSVCKRRSYLYAQIPVSFHETSQNVDEFLQRHLYNQDSKRLYKTRIEDWVIERSPNGAMVQYWVNKIEKLYPGHNLSRVKKFNLYIKELHKEQAKKPPKTSICQVCDKEYEVKPLARKSFTCSPECQDFRKVNKLSPDEIEQAKAAFDPENLVEWANQFMCRQNEKGPGYNQTAFEDPRWARLNRLEEEVQAVCKDINAHNMNVPSEADEKLSRRDLWKAWQKGTKYRPCAHCGGFGKFHQYRGWQEFCSVDCQRGLIPNRGEEMEIFEDHEFLTENGLGERLDWICSRLDLVLHKDKRVPGMPSWRLRPDFRIDELKVVVEFDGLFHYTKPKQILNDFQKDKELIEMGYRVIRIPYFVQWCPYIAEQIFGDRVIELTPDETEQTFPHGFIADSVVLPAEYCTLGINRFNEQTEKLPSEIEKEILLSLHEKLKIENHLKVLPLFGLRKI